MRYHADLQWVRMAFRDFSRTVVVWDIRSDSFADKVGFSKGDVILEFNRIPVNSADEFGQVQSKITSGQDAVFLVRPRGASRTIFMAGTLP